MPPGFPLPRVDEEYQSGNARISFSFVRYLDMKKVQQKRIAQFNFNTFYSKFCLFMCCVGYRYIKFLIDFI